MGNRALKHGMCCDSQLSQDTSEFTYAKNALTEACEDIRRETCDSMTKIDPAMCYVSLSVVHPSYADTVYEINPLGYKHSPRTIKDGLTYIGHNESWEGQANDILLSAEVKQAGNHARISYDWANNNYFIEDLGEGPGIYRKLHNALVINKRRVLHFSGYFVQIEPSGTCRVIKDGQVSEHTLRLQEASTIGRDPNCSVVIEDPSVSKVQVSLLVRQGQCLAFDGDFETKKPSHNGTWLQIEEKTRLLNGMVLKLGENTMAVKLFTKS